MAEKLVAESSLKHYNDQMPLSKTASGGMILKNKGNVATSSEVLLGENLIGAGAASPTQAGFGQYNKQTNALLFVGNGSQETNRKNAFEVFEDHIVVDGHTIDGDHILPSPSEEEDGAFLRIVDGKWQAVKVPSAESATFGS